MPYVRYYNDDIYVAEHIQATNLKRKLLALWPRKTVTYRYNNGTTEDIEVFAEHFYYYDWPRANGTRGVVLEPDEGYWRNGVQYLGKGYDKTRHAKKIYDLVGIKYKPDNWRDVKADYYTYARIFGAVLTFYQRNSTLPMVAEDILGIVIQESVEADKFALNKMFRTTVFPLAEFADILNYLNTFDTSKLDTDLKYWVIRFMETVIGYVDVDDCIATGTEYIENIKIKRLDRGYFYLQYDTLDEFRIEYLDKVSDTTYAYPSLNMSTVLNNITDKLPKIYPLNRDPFNVDPLLPYWAVDELDPTKGTWVTPELTDLNPDPDKDTEDPAWDGNGWVSAYIDIVNVPRTMHEVDIMTNVNVYPQGVFNPFVPMNGPRYNFSEDKDDHSLLAVLSDSAGVLFERTFTLEHSPTLSHFGNKTCILHIRYRRINSPATLIGTSIEEAFKKNYWVALQKLTATYTTKPPILPYVDITTKYTIPATSAEGSIVGATFLAPFEYINYTPSCSIAAANVVFGSNTTSTGLPSSIRAPLKEGKKKYTDNGQRVRTNYVQYTMKARTLSRAFGSFVNHGYTINERSRLEKAVKKVVKVVLTVVGIVIVTISYVIYGSMGAVIANFVIQIVYRVAAAIMYKNGMDYYAEAVVDAADYVQTYTTVLVIYDMASSALTNIGATEITNMTVQQIVDYAITSIQDFVIEQLTAGATSFATMTTEQVVMSVINILNAAFKAYSEYIDPPNKGIEEMEELVKTQNEELASMKIGGDMMNVIQTYLDTPFSNQYDFNEVMHASYNKLTQGKINEVYTRYYNGISPFRYDPYWG